MTKDSQKYEMTRKRKIIAGCVFCAVIFFITLLKGGAIFPSDPGILLSEGNDTTETVLTDSGIESVPLEPEARIVVDIAGAVSQPGIRILPEGSRVYEAIEAAGGMLPEGEPRDINLAEELLDGQKLYIPSVADYEANTGENSQHSGQSERNGTVKKKVNINSASLTELQTLTGVGPATAERILDYRSQNGKFKKIDELKNVKGIGEKTFEKLRDFITVT